MISWISQTKLPRRANPGDDSDICMYDAKGRGQFGFSLSNADLNGDGIQELIVAAPRANTNLSGSVSVLFV